MISWRLLLRILEILFCFTGAVIFHFIDDINSIWLQEGITLGLLGYFIILIVCLIASSVEHLPSIQDFIFLCIGFIINFICSIMTFIMYFLKKKAHEVKDKPEEHHHLEAALGSIHLTIAVLMVADLILGAVNLEDEN
ncbi:unnamed protein product [Phyllotreta striolata]|uniref:MARVEL domain-containing protein n=1 Tax=Phyllotreta striolata TaxID=444603 RepID=A0A9N9TQW2_PHYSR|nr:unnamed protein product [Phyllotreta striolata]